jgi:hypothetical protein
MHYLLLGFQQSYRKGGQSSAAIPVPTPIPLSEIASKGRSAAEFLRNVETSLSNDQTIATIE